MENHEPVVIDKTAWPRGEWDHEPDKVNWITRAGLDGMIHRGPGGNLCGYVAVPREHPLYGKDYGDVDADVSVHGGLTYAAPCEGTICHVPEPGRPADVWWFGFDCAHYYDASPAWAALHPSDPSPWMGGSYKPIAFVRAEVEQLAAQLAALA